MGRPKSRQTTVIGVPEEYTALLLDFVNQLDRLKGESDRFPCKPIITLRYSACAVLSLFANSWEATQAQLLLPLLFIPMFSASGRIIPPQRSILISEFADKLSAKISRVAQ